MPRSRAFINAIEVSLDAHGFQVLERNDEESSSSESSWPALRKRRNDAATGASTKRSRTTTTPKQYTQPPAVSLEKDDLNHNNNKDQLLQTVRQQHILGCRIARSLPCTTANSQDAANSHPYCYGRVISVQQQPGDNHHDLDQDLYRVSYEDGGMEDLDTLTLFDAVLLHWKLVPDCSEAAEILADSLFRCSPRVRRFHNMLSEKERANIDSIRIVKVDEEVVCIDTDEALLFGSLLEYGPRKHDDNSTHDDDSHHNDDHVWTVFYDNGSYETLSWDQVKAAAEEYNTVASQDPAPIQMEHLAMYQAYMPPPMGSDATLRSYPFA